MNSFMAWVGGKKALRDEIVTRLSHSCDRDVKAFTQLHDMQEGLRVLARKAAEKMVAEYSKKFPNANNKTKESEEEPLVERDFEG